MRASCWAVALLGWLIALPALAEAPADDILVDTAAAKFNVGLFSHGKQTLPAGTVQSVTGKFTTALQFDFVEGAAGGFMTTRLSPKPDWDKTDGFSFWVKGDGLTDWGGIELIDHDDFSLRYGYCFPITSKEWRLITVRWSDLMPELAGPLVGGKDGYRPSRFGSFWVGKWFYWHEYPSASFAIERIALEPKIDIAPEPKFEPGLKRFRAKLSKHEPVSIVTMGDSLTDEHHWSNRDVVWHGLLAKAIRTKYDSHVKITNPAIGGTTLSQNTVLIPRWLKDEPEPDLVTIWFGGNDWDSNVRGERFADYLRAAVDRVRRQTHGHADILIMTNVPGHESWETRKELETAAKAVAVEKQTGLADIGAVFRAAGSADEARKREYWGFDSVHLGKAGHAVVCDAVMKALDAEN